MTFNGSLLLENQSNSAVKTKRRQNFLPKVMFCHLCIYFFYISFVYRPPFFMFLSTALHIVVYNCRRRLEYAYSLITMKINVEGKLRVSQSKRKTRANSFTNLKPYITLSVRLSACQSVILVLVCNYYYYCHYQLGVQLEILSNSEQWQETTSNSKCWNIKRDAFTKNKRTTRVEYGWGILQRMLIL